MSDMSSAINLKSLGASLALLVSGGAVAAGVIAGVIFLQQQEERVFAQLQSQLSETKRRLARVHEDERDIRDKISRYEELIARGRSIPERRLEWVETLQRIKESRKLLGLDYEIAPQRPLDEKNISAGGYDFLASPMRLEMPLLHENDLLGLIADLSANVQALVSVRQCRIERAPANPGERLYALLKAHCEIDWITLRERI